MLSLITIELNKVFRRKRSYIGFLALLVLVSVLQFAMWLEGKTLLDMIMQNLKDAFVIQGNLLNGYFISFMLMNTLWVLMPFLVTFVAGDSIAGEAHSGTLRIMLTRPASRAAFVIAKYIASIEYTLLLVLFLMLLSLGVSSLIFGTGDLIVFRSQLTIFPESEVLPRFLMAFGFAFLAMSVVASLAFLFSTLTNNSIGPIIGTMAIVISFTIITNLNLAAFEVIRKFLFTTYMSSWTLFFDYQLDWAQISTSILVCLGHVAVFFTLALWIFNRKDILT
ncbi:MAG: ABC transporter permease subunit [Bacteroidetes bacterium]|nr:ABC transporter permease subunit [Bacteroidota bacterium]